MCEAIEVLEISAHKIDVEVCSGRLPTKWEVTEDNCDQTSEQQDGSNAFLTLYFCASHLINFKEPSEMSIRLNYLVLFVVSSICSHYSHHAGKVAPRLLFFLVCILIYL